MTQKIKDRFSFFNLIFSLANDMKNLRNFEEAVKIYNCRLTPTLAERTRDSILVSVIF